VYLILLLHIKTQMVEWRLVPYYYISASRHAPRSVHIAPLFIMMNKFLSKVTRPILCEKPHPPARFRHAKVTYCTELAPDPYAAVAH